jgi:prepilin-type N-terminal cleavage/methylation domain-containing protein
MRKVKESGFSLLEMLVVLAITAVLLGIIIVPMIQSFNFTRAAESLAEQQQRARILVDQIARDISNATAVGDNEGLNGETVVDIPYGGTSIPMPLFYSRIDVYKPAQGGQVSLDASSGAISITNSKNGHIDPTLKAPNGQTILPASQGATIVRYFVGLRHPVQTDNHGNPISGVYFNPYGSPLTPLTSANSDNPENLFVLYRLEFQPYTLSSGGALVPSTLFMPNPTNANEPYLNDPFFFTYDPVNDPILKATPALKTQRINEINAILQQATIVTEESRFDMIQPLYDLATQKVLLDANGNPRVLSLVQFRPSPVSSEPAVGANPVALGNETATPNSANFANLGIAPNVLRTTMGAWSGELIQVNPFNGSSQFSNNVYENDFLTFDTRSNAPILPQSTTVPQQTVQNLLILNPFLNSSLPANLVMFDSNAYASAVALSGTTPQYPFSQAVSAAEAEDPSGDDWLALSQSIQYTPSTIIGLTTIPGTTTSYRDEFVPFDFNPHSGQINTSFSIQQVGNVNASVKNANNSPEVSTSGTAADPGLAAMTPTSDSIPDTANFYDPDYTSINEKFNAGYILFNGTNPGTYNGKSEQMDLRGSMTRSLDLRLEPELDGWSSPMDLDPTDAAPLSYMQNGTTLSTSKTPWVAGWTGFGNVTIVPGSEVVIGPDQTPGPNMGNPVRYMRVVSNPGPDQYMMNYTNLPEPYDYRVFDANAANDTTFWAGQQDSNYAGYFGPKNQHYDPILQQWELDGAALDTQDPVTMLLQPRFKVGYVQFDSDPGTAMPVGNVQITYKFQFNRPADAISVSYDSRQVINVLLSIRSYPQTTNMPNAQTITVQASAPVKNFIR